MPSSPSQQIHIRDASDDWLTKETELERRNRAKQYRPPAPEPEKRGRKLLLIIGLLIFIQSLVFFFIPGLMPVSIVQTYMNIYGPATALIGALLVIKAMGRKKREKTKMRFKR